MKRKNVLIVGVSAFCMFAAAITAVAFAGAATDASRGLTISSGVSVNRASFSDQDRWLLSNIGETGAIVKIGERGGTFFYEGSNDDGEMCFMTGSNSDGGGLSGGCQSGSSKLEQSLVDMSSVCVNPESGDWRLARIQGIAADGISAVGVVDTEGVVHRIPVAENIYKMSSSDIPEDGSCPGIEAKAIVALDENGSSVYSKSFPTN